MSAARRQPVEQIILTDPDSLQPPFDEEEMEEELEEEEEEEEEEEFDEDQVQDDQFGK